MRFIVGKAEEIPPGSRKIVRVAGRSIGVFNVDGEYYAIRNRCPHQGAPLCEGKLWGVLKSDVPGQFEYSGTKEIIACISHGWEFSLKTGQSWCDPKRLRVRSYQVDIQPPEDIAPTTPAATPDRVKTRTIVTANPAPSEGPNGEAAPAACACEVTPEALTEALSEARSSEADPDAPAPGMVKGPYTVETYPVTVEGGYLYLVVDVTDVADRGVSPVASAGAR